MNRSSRYNNESDRLPSINNRRQNDFFKKNCNRKNFSPEIKNDSNNFPFDISVYNPKSKAIKVNSLYLSQNNNQPNILKISSVKKEEINSDKNNISVTYYGGRKKNNLNNLNDIKNYNVTKRTNRSTITNQIVPTRTQWNK